MRATPKNIPPQLQQEIETWASRQGISTEQFIWQAVAEKISALNQQVAGERAAEPDSEAVKKLPLQHPKVYRKEGILVVEASLAENFALNPFIDELREERIREQMAW